MEQRLQIRRVHELLEQTLYCIESGAQVDTLNRLSDQMVETMTRGTLPGAYCEFVAIFVSAVYRAKTDAYNARSGPAKVSYTGGPSNFSPLMGTISRILHDFKLNCIDFAAGVGFWPVAMHIIHCHEDYQLVDVKFWDAVNEIANETDPELATRMTDFLRMGEYGYSFPQAHLILMQRGADGAKDLQREQSFYLSRAYRIAKENGHENFCRTLLESLNSRHAYTSRPNASALLRRELLGK